MDDFLRRAQEEMIPKMRESAFVVSIISGAVDAKIAVEIGAAVLLNKPIIVAVVPGAQVPEKLVRVADHIVEANPRSPTATADFNRAIQEIVAGLPSG